MSSHKLAPLEVALAASKPIETGEPLAVEMLVASHLRIVTVADHEKFRETLENPHKNDADLTNALLQ